MPVSLNLLMNEQAVLDRLRKRFGLVALLHLLRVVYDWRSKSEGGQCPRRRPSSV
jgi:hypothetical protein